MSDEHTNHARPHRALEWSHPLSQLLEMALILLSVALAQFILGHFSWFQQFESRHFSWVLLLFSSATLATLFIFRRKQRLADHLRFREDLRAGRVQRMSLTMRCVVMVISLGLVVAGSLVEHGTILLLFGVPVLLLFAVEELNIILRPGDSVHTNPRDELLAHFKARSLQVGYLVAILSLVVLYLVSLFATRYMSALLAVGLIISLLAPSLFYGRLDRRAGTDE